MSLIVVIRNVSALAPTSDYEYRVLVGDGTPERSTVIAHGQVKGHVRADGWKPLVQRVVDEAQTLDPMLEAIIAVEKESRA